ncbi:hypothetical protein Hdeb2414_s0009g00300131 [Helianthus debilis subsp. tardiflorus]
MIMVVLRPNKTSLTLVEMVDVMLTRLLLLMVMMVYRLMTNHRSRKLL